MQHQVLLNLIWLCISFKHFSEDFKFDLCHDFSFWKAETGRCIPKEIFDEELNTYYSFPPICNRTEFDCIDGYFNKYCPNNYESCEEENYFFCNESKTCVPKGEII